MKSLASKTLSPTNLVLLSIGSTQLGSALAKSLFSEIEPVGMVLLRVGFAAIMLFVFWKPSWRRELLTHFSVLALFGLSLALMNFCFYAAIARIPIGIAVALEFIGPLGLSVARSHRRLDWLWAMLAAIGIILLAPIGDFALDLIGILFALLAGSFWAAYIVLSARTGRAIAGGEGLAWAMAIAALVLMPWGIAFTGAALLQPKILLLGMGVALLSSAIPYSLELEALRSLPMSIFGILLSLEPVVAAIIGFLLLGETLQLRAIIAIILVAIAAAGAARS